MFGAKLHPNKHVLSKALNHGKMKTGTSTYYMRKSTEIHCPFVKNDDGSIYRKSSLNAKIKKNRTK